MTHASLSPVTREMAGSCYERGRSRPICIRLEGATVRCRLKGTRKEFVCDARTVFNLAVRVTVAAQRAERKKLREEKRKERL